MATTSIVQLTADLAASTASGAVSQLMPSGTVLPFAGRNVPAGWLLCDGSEVSKTTYSNLYLALLDASGTAGVYDAQVNPTSGSSYAAPASGNFRLPDYRGLFLRGTGTASGGDATTVGGHQSQKTALNGIAISTSDSAASVSGLKNQMNGGTGTGSVDHTHLMSGYGRKFTLNGGSDTTRFRLTYDGVNAKSDAIGTDGSGYNHTHSWDFGSATFSASGTATAQTVTKSGDNETRPVNRGINYIIKV